MSLKEKFDKIKGPLEMLLGAGEFVGATWILTAKDIGAARYPLALMVYYCAIDQIKAGMITSRIYNLMYNQNSDSKKFI